jgi:hypothetical protein
MSIRNVQKICLIVSTSMTGYPKPLFVMIPAWDFESCTSATISKKVGGPAIGSVPDQGKVNRTGSHVQMRVRLEGEPILS